MKTLFALYFNLNFISTSNIKDLSVEAKGNI